jgi:hypothetical protein
MNKFYIPCQGRKPAPLEINGHRLLLLSRDPELLEEALDTIGADRVKEVKVRDGEDAEVELFTKLSSQNGAGVLVISPELSFSELQDSLHHNLPWLQ